VLHLGRPPVLLLPHSLLTDNSFAASAPSQTSKHFSKVVFLSLVFSPAFLLLDHIHFQYNGPLFSLLVFSLLEAATRPLLSAFLFSSLLCFKHIFLYIAPAYFFYLLRTYCLSPSWRPQLLNGVKLGLVVLAPISAAFGPFIALRQMQVVAERLFPFQRGLCHAYWAPNFWALYSFLDRIAIHRSVSFCAQANISGTNPWTRNQKRTSSVKLDERVSRRYKLCSPTGDYISNYIYHHFSGSNRIPDVETQG